MHRPARFALSAVMLAVMAPSVLAHCQQSSPAAEAIAIEDHRAKNQASATDTIILPPAEFHMSLREGDKDVEVPAPGTQGPGAMSQLAMALKSAGLPGLHTIALIDGVVDADGCQRAPISATYADNDARSAYRAGGHSASVDALANIFRSHGFAITTLSATAINAADIAEQKKLAATKGSYAVQFGNSEKRWFSTSEERRLCMTIADSSSPDAQKAWKVKHLAILRQMTALHLDAVLAIAEESGKSKGASWNILEQELSSSGNGIDVPKSSAQISATLVLKDGSVAWSGEGFAEGALRPSAEQDALVQLKTYIQAKISEWQKSQQTHANATPPAMEHEAFNAIASGNLDDAPAGSALGPSVWATQLAAAQRLYEQLGPALQQR